MRLTRTRQALTGGLDRSLAAMIDVVFLLLIFFLVTTTFLVPERLVDPTLLVEREDGVAAGERIEPLLIEVVVIDGAPVYRIGSVVAASEEAIVPIIERYPDKTSGAWIRLANDAPFGMAAVAVNRCKEAGFAQVSLVPLTAGEDEGHRP